MVENNQDKIIETPIYEPDPDDRIRILIKHNNLFRSIFWFQVKKDGSLYLAPRYQNITSVKRGSKLQTGNKVRINYDDETYTSISDQSKIRGAHVSRHASGIINAGEQRSFSPSFRTISKQKLEFLVSFEHPNAYGIVTKPKKRDCCLNYPIDENCPLTAQFYVAPKERTSLVNIPSAKHQLNLLFEYSNLEISDITCQLILNHGPSGPWPPHTTIVWREEMPK